MLCQQQESTQLLSTLFCFSQRNFYGASVTLCPMWLFMVEAGFVGFIVSLFCAIWRGFGADGKARRNLRPWVLAATIFFLMWIIGLRNHPIPLTQ